MGLFPAYRPTGKPFYSLLVERFGIDNVYILSRGWGLIRGSFLTPHYDITFEDAEGPVVFFGGKGYLPLFMQLTRGLRGADCVLQLNHPPGPLGLPPGPIRHADAHQLALRLRHRLRLREDRHLIRGQNEHDHSLC
jgi:hypothetical protein